MKKKIYTVNLEIQLTSNNPGLFPILHLTTIHEVQPILLIPSFLARFYCLQILWKKKLLLM